MEIWSRLEKLGAGEEVVDHVRAIETADDDLARGDIERIWAACRRADAAVWLAAQRGARVPDIVAAVMACVRLAAGDAAPDGPVADALDAAGACLAGDEDARARCIEAAEACVEIADSSMPAATYRGSSDEGLRALARAAEWVARATEGLSTAAARFWAVRAASARTTGALLGIPSSAVLGLSPERPLELKEPTEDEAPAQDELAFVLAAAAESAAHSARALAAPSFDDATIAEAHATCVAMMREALDETR